MAHRIWLGMSSSLLDDNLDGSGWDHAKVLLRYRCRSIDWPSDALSDSRALLHAFLVQYFGFSRPLFLELVRLPARFMFCSCSASGGRVSDVPLATSS
ncbi:hypothetical protein BT69DRAFT_1286502, partial [Atractiella rhizophila]